MCLVRENDAISGKITKSDQTSTVILTVYNILHTSPKMTLYASCMKQLVLSAMHFIQKFQIW